MQLVIGGKTAQASGTCAGPVNSRNEIHSECVVCGKCDALIRDLMKDATIAAATLAARTQQPSAQTA